MLEHDRYGYRWVPEKNDTEALKISFFGGSTGYNGEPPIATMIESMLNENGVIRAQVANFSVVSSNHRQHLHNIIESRSLFRPDIVIFYGGYNEVVSPAYYDPRPGFPYNYFFREETTSLNQMLMLHSPSIYLLDGLLARNGIDGLTPLVRLRREQMVFSEQWEEEVMAKYFDTVELARAVTSSFESDRCGRSIFLFFYQPFKVPSELKNMHEAIKLRLDGYSYGFDISGTFGVGDMDVFTDSVHITQSGRKVIAEEITRRLKANDEYMSCFD